MIQLTDDLVVQLGRFIGEKISEATKPLKQKIAALEAKQAKIENFRYVGVWTEGTRYLPGNFATVDGSLWHCNLETTNRPGRDVGAWIMVCKRGADGKDAPSLRAPTGHRPNGSAERRPSF